MMKNALLLLALAGVFAFGTACFGLFTKTDPAAQTTVEGCAGLSGQAKIDCEKRHPAP